MNKDERFIWTYDRQTGEPLGIVDTTYPSSQQPAVRPAGTVSLPPKALLVLVGFALVSGMYGGVLLFGHRPARPTTVVFCPAPTEQVALRPAECGPPAPRTVTR